MVKKSERWKKKEEDRLKKLILLRFGFISLVGAIGVGLIYLGFRNEPSLKNNAAVQASGNLEDRSYTPSLDLLPIKYDTAQKSSGSDIRREYCKQISNTNFSPFVSEVIYDPDNQFALKYIQDMFESGKLDRDFANSLKEELLGGGKVSKQYMRTIIIDSLFGNEKSVPIFIAKSAFDNYEEEEFRSALLDHEFFHAEDIYKGIQLEGCVLNSSNARLLNVETLRSIVELRALRNQMTKWRLAGRDIHSGYFVNLVSGFVRYYLMLKKITPKNDFEKFRIEEQLKLYKQFIPERFENELND